tara:strand:+ start:7155 stop:7721 length:567 start_codon:yes stop_codon:yes gene_type:complete
MRIFLSILILIFTHQSWTKADDISDFEIEGISVGDSLLSHFTKKEIIENISYNYEETNKKFTSVDFYNLSNKYEFIQFHYKTNDKNYEIYSIDGIFSWDKPPTVCNSERLKINNQISNAFTDLKYEEFLNSDMASRRGFMDANEYYFSNGDFIQLTCYKYKDKYSDYRNHGRLGIVRKELDDWIVSIE